MRVAAGGLAAHRSCEAVGVEVRSHVTPHRRGRACRRARAARGRPSTAIEESPVRCGDAADGGRHDRGDRPRQEGRRHGRRRLRGRGAGPPARPRLLRPVGPQARRPPRPGPHVDPRREGGRASAPASRPATTPGSAFHDEILYDDERGLHRGSNRAGGLEGGVTNGEELRAQAVVKPIPTLLMPPALHRHADEGAAAGLGRAQRHLRRARGRRRGRGHGRPGPRRRRCSRSSGATPSPSSSTTRRRPARRTQEFLARR